MQLAQEANDRTLLLRCYVNVPSVMSSDMGFRQAIPMWEEGLERARRSMDRHSIFWLANNLAESFHEMGRLEEALALHHEVIAAACGIGLGHGGLASMCWTLIQKGRLDEARDIWREIQDDEPEPQDLSRWAYLPAALGWADDPHRSVDHLQAAVGRNELYHTTVSLLARMALRTGRDDALRVAANSLRGLAVGTSDSPSAAHAEWASALLRPDRAQASERVAQVAATFEAMEHPLAAADAYADAAWLAHRASVPVDEWADRAAALYAACSAVPLLEARPATVARP